MNDRINHRWRVARTLGEGGMGTVYLVNDRFDRGQPLALKVLKKDRLKNVDYFQHEFRLLAGLRHPNLVTVHDFGYVEETGAPFYTSDYVEGTNFFDATRNMGPGELYDLIVQICRGLHYIHARGLIHCDIKPENLMVVETEEGPRVKIMDFGLAEEREPASGRTGARIKGTVHYMAPEIAREEPFDHRVDLYSLGVTLYHVVTRRLPYGGSSTFSIIRKHIEAPPEPPAAIDSDIPTVLEELILRLMAKEPQKRPWSANDVIRYLNRETGRDFRLETEETVRSSVLSGRHVGRTEEMKRVTRDIDALLDPEGRCRVYEIVGESGIGKSRLIRELKVICQLRRVPFCDATCLPYGEGARPFERILRRLVPILASTRGNGTAATIREALDTYAPELRLLAPEATSQLGPGPVSTSSPLAVADRIGEFFCSLAESWPIVLAIEDIHHADAQTIELLGGFLRNIAHTARKGEPPRLICILTRQPNRGDFAVEIGVEGLLAEMELFPLGPDAIRDLLASMLGLEEIPAPLVERIEDETGGNPFHIQEVLQVLAERAVQIHGRELRNLKKEELLALEIPTSVTEAIQNRLDRLPEETRRLAQRLSVFSGSIPYLVAVHLHTGDSEAASVLDDLERRQILRRKDEDDTWVFTFAHGKLRETILQNLKKKERRELHLLAAEALREAGRPDRIIVELAHHLDKGGDYERALPLLMQAAREAKRELALRDADRWFERVLHLLDTHPSLLSSEERTDIRFRALEGRAELAAAFGETERAIGIYGRVLDHRGAEGTKHLSRILRSIGELHLGRGNYGEAVRYFRRALHELGLDDLRREDARILIGLSRVHLWQGDYEAAMDLAMQALEVYRETDADTEIPSVYLLMSSICFYRADYRESRTHLREAIRLAREQKTKVRSLISTLGMAYFDRGELGRALDHVSEHGLNRRTVGDAYGVTISFSDLSTFYNLWTRPEARQEYYERSLDRCLKAGDVQGAALSQNNLACVALIGGAYRTALSHLEDGLDRTRTAADYHGEAVALHNLGIVFSLAGARDRARDRFRQALSIVTDRNILWLEGYVRQGLGRGIAPSMDQAGMLKRSEEIFAELGNRKARGDVLLDLARLYLDRGERRLMENMLDRWEELKEPVPSADSLAWRNLIEGRAEAEQEEWIRARSLLAVAHQEAERTGFQELIWRIHLQTAQVRKARGDVMGAGREVEAAKEIVDALAQNLPRPLRPRFLARPLVRKLRKLHLEVTEERLW